MKTILRIIAILLVAALVAAGFKLAVDGSLTTTGTGTTAFNNGSQQPSFERDGNRPDHMDGDRDGEHGASFGVGLFGMLASLLKLSAIGGLALLIIKGYETWTAQRRTSVQA
jgi:hypothetical protein